MRIFSRGEIKRRLKKFKIENQFLKTMEISYLDKKSSNKDQLNDVH